MYAKHTSFYYLLTGLFLLRLLIAPQFGLGVDEAHYCLYGVHPALSYFDHPPLVGWVQYLFMSLLGENEFAARLSAAIIGAVTLWILYFFVYEITGKRTLSMVAVLALSASFMFNALFLMLLPDTLLLLLIIPIIRTTVALAEVNSTKNWLALGLLLGVAGLAKYTAVLFIVPIALYFVIKKEYRLFYTPKILIGIVPALVLIAPVIVWNMQHDWVSFSFQSEHVVGASTVNWGGFARSIVSQFAAYSPFLFPVAYYGLYRALRSNNEKLFVSGLFGLVLIVFFTFASLYKTALPHWSALFYLLFIPIGSVMLWQKSRLWQKYLIGSIGFSLLVSLVLYAELALKFIPQPDYRSLHRDIYGYNTIMQEANALLSDTDRQAIAVTHWSIAARALFYNSSYKSGVFLIDERYNQYDIWQDRSPVGHDLLFITTHDFHADIAHKMNCQEVQKVKSIDLTLNGHKVNTVDYTWCKNFQGENK